MAGGANAAESRFSAGEKMAQWLELRPETVYLSRSDKGAELNAGSCSRWSSQVICGRFCA
jgi:hypothetical protein